MFALSLLIVTYAGWRAVGLRLDDALIYARCVQNLLAGHGLVFNPGETRNAVTSPLFVWTLAGLASVIPDIPLAGNLFGLACIAGTVYLVTFRIFPPEESPWVGAAAGLLFASANLTYKTLGMESPLLLLLVTALLAARRHAPGLVFAVIAGLCLVTRAETVLLVAPLYIAHAYRERRLPWRAAGLTIGTTVPFFAANLALFGHALPDTLTAKMLQGQSGFWGERWVFLSGATGILQTWYVGLPIACLGALLAAIALADALLTRRAQSPVPPACGFVLGVVVFYAAFSIPAYHWYLTPVVWALCIAAPAGVAVCSRLAQRRRMAVTRLVRTAGIAALAVMVFGHVRSLPELPNGPDARYFAAATWLRDHVSPARSLGAAEVGHLGFYTALRIVDLAGLITPGTASFLGRRDVDSWIRVYRPDYILIHAPVWPMEAGAARALDDGLYDRVEAFPVPGFTLLGPPDSQASPAIGSLLGRLNRSDAFVREGVFSVGDSDRPGLFMHPVNAASFPASSDASVFEAFLGVASPIPVPPEADGVTFVVAIREGGVETEMVRRHVRPGAWDPVRVTLPPSPERRKRRLFLRTEPGPRGDGSYDWGIWGEPTVRLAPVTVERPRPARSGSRGEPPERLGR